MKLTAIITAIFIIFISINLFPEKIAEFSDIYRPSMMDISNGEIYILDNFSVKVFSFNNFRFLREFGKKGEGPGELRSTSDTGATMIVRGEHIFLNSVYKLIVFNKAGEIVKEEKFQDYIVEAMPIDENYVLTIYKWIDQTAYAITTLADNKFSEKKELYRTRLPQSHKIKKISMPPLCTYVRTSKDKIFLFDQQKDVIKVFDKKGNQKPDITFKYGKIITTEGFKTKVMDYILSRPELKKIPEDIKQEYLKRVYTPNVLPVFKNSWVVGGEIYIQTYREKQNKSEFLILDFSGKVEKKMFLPDYTELNIRINPASTFTFYKGKYYYLKENLDQEVWELYVMEI